MIKNKIKQFKFDSSSSGENLTITGYNIKRIGIQGPPKTLFYFNGMENNLIEIGSTGIFELDLLDTSGDISKVTIDTIPTLNGNEKVIVDILYQQYIE